MQDVGTRLLAGRTSCSTPDVGTRDSVSECLSVALAVTAHGVPRCAETFRSPVSTRLGVAIRDCIAIIY